MESEGVNPVQGVEVSRVQSSLYRREPPPPYTADTNQNNVVSHQPIAQQTVYVQVPLKQDPEFYTCPHCQQRVLTKVKYINSKKTHLMAGFICGFTIWCLICCLGALPYVLRTCKKAEHYCPNCEQHLGSYSKI